MVSGADRHLVAVTVRDMRKVLVPVQWQGPTGPQTGCGEAPLGFGVLLVTLRVWRESHFQDPLTML